MLTKRLVILCLLIFSFQAVSYFSIGAAYQWNKNFIANYLCINKGKPELKCNGKCYLKKQIEQKTTNDTDTQIPPLIVERLSIVLFAPNEAADWSIHPLFEDKIQTYSYFYYKFEPSLSVFHPPQVCRFLS